MFTYQTDGEFEKWVESGLSTFETWHLVAEIYLKNTFNDGDRIEIDDGCNYVGHLAIEKDACVAMTGCFGSDDIELTIMSSHAVGSTGFLWTKEGVIHAVDVNEKVIPLSLRPHKKRTASVVCLINIVYSIANFVASWLKWLQIISNDFS